MKFARITTVVSLLFWSISIAAEEVETTSAAVDPSQQVNLVQQNEVQPVEAEGGQVDEVEAAVVDGVDESLADLEESAAAAEPPFVPVEQPVEAVLDAGESEGAEWEDATETEQDPAYEYIEVYEDVVDAEIPSPQSLAGQPPKTEEFFPLGREPYKSPLIWLPVLVLSWLVLMRLGRRKSVDLGDDGFSMHLSHKGRKQLEEKQCDSGGYQGPKAF